jgi:hypothetical protein
MREIKTATDLKTTIRDLEFKQAEEYILLKEELHNTYENLQPLNILKRTIKDVYSATDAKSSIANNVIGMATGFVAKKIFLGKTNNPLSKLLGFIMEIVVANKVVKNGDKIKSIGSNILKRFVNKGNETDIM